VISLSHAFGLSGEPFLQDIPTDKLFPLPGLKPFLERFDYAVHIGAVSVITGEVGSGKSTSLRAAGARLHPSQYIVVPLVASSGSVLEFLRQLSLQLGAPPVSSSISRMVRSIHEMLCTAVAKKQRPVIIIDEAHLMRLELLAQLHTLMQLPYDQRSLVPLILSGQNLLIDRLLYHTSHPFSSRIVGRTLLQGLKLDDMRGYLHHHLQIAGGSPELFAEEAILAVHQSSGGLLRRANHLARGSLLAAASENAPVVSAEHVRIASTEIF
jgi:type II secretory pathway predicted ATPase ExeA